MRWIKPTERLPDNKQVVILKVTDKNGIYIHGDGYVDGFNGKDQWFLGDPKHDFPVKLTNDATEWLDQSADQYPDTEADGVVFCGKCGKTK